MIKEYMLSDTVKKEEIDSDSSVVLSDVIRNDCVCEVAQKYLELCESMDNGELQKEQILNKVSLPADLMAVEKGVEILVKAYDNALQNSDVAVCADIKDELKSMSEFYLEKVSDAYFSASNILLDASAVEESQLEQFKNSCNSLKSIYLSWPFSENKSDVGAFFEMVDKYSKNAENSTHCSKHAGRSNNVSDYMNFSSHQRGM